MGSYWEYRVVGQTENPLENQAKLNRLGKEGWELVAVAHLGSGGILAAYLKRLSGSYNPSDAAGEGEGTGSLKPIASSSISHSMQRSAG
jgi:hypothetical protein